MLRKRIWPGAVLVTLVFGTVYAQQPKKQPPNIVLILADDLGFSDLGSFGSEIHTPNLDRLSREGVKLTSFYNAGRCCPSRAALLTGLYPHQAGIGDMVQDKGSPAYQGFLSDHSATIAQLLKTRGYNTIVSGKWHVGLVPSALAHNRGFDQSFTMQNNGASYFNSEPLYNDGRTVTFLLNGQKIERQDTSRYLTQAITDFATRALDNVTTTDNPFFLYVAYTAPHWPIQALPEDITRYKSKYLEGWQEIRKQRFARQQELGIIDRNWKLSEAYKGANWSSLTDKERENWALRMAIYAAMIDRMDQGVGEILEKLKATGKDKNTLVIFVSDNGGSADTVKDWDYVTQKNGTPGSVASIDSYYPEWGNVSNTPFRLFKKNTHEGGISSPFIARFPGQIPFGTTSNQSAHLIDLLPTFLDWSDTKYPKALNEKELTALPGKSLKPILTGTPSVKERTLFWEHEGSKAVRSGKWKLVAEIHQPWELYDLSADRSETNNLAARYPERVKALEQQYLAWAKKVGVVDWDLIK